MKQKSYASDYEPVRRVRRAQSAWWDEAEQHDDEQYKRTQTAEEEVVVWPTRVRPGATEDEETAGAESNLLEPNARSEKRETWKGKRGHALAYTGLFLYTIALYFRPYEWHASLAGLVNLSFWFALFTLAVFVPTQLALEGRPT